MAYPAITPLPTPPSRQDPTNFADEADAFLGAIPTFQSEANTLGAYLDAEVIIASEWASKTNGIVDSTDYASKAWAIGGTGVTNTASAGAAKEWATKPEDSTVDGTGYSALHYSAKSAASSTASANSATESANSATAAANSAATAGAIEWVSGTTYNEGDVVYSPLNYKNYRAKQTTSGTTDPSLDTTNWADLTTASFGVWEISESGGDLYFSVSGVNKMKLDASGNLDVVGNVNTNATIT